MREHALGQDARDLLPGRGAAAWTTRRRECPPSRPGLVVEVDAEVDEVDDPRRRLLGQGADGARAAEAAARAERVLGVQLG